MLNLLSEYFAAGEVDYRSLSMNVNKILGILFLTLPVYGMEVEKESRKRKIEEVIEIEPQKSSHEEPAGTVHLSLAAAVEEFKRNNLFLDQHNNAVQIRVTDQFTASQEDLSCGYTALLNGVSIANFLKGQQSCSTLATMLTNVPLIKVMCLDRRAAWRNIIAKARKRKMLANFVCNRLLLSLKGAQKVERGYTLAFNEGAVAFENQDPVIEAFRHVIGNVKSYLAECISDGVRERLKFDSIFKEFNEVFFLDHSICNGLLKAQSVQLAEHEIRLILKKVIENKVKRNAGTEDEAKFDYKQLSTDDAINAYFPQLAAMRFIITPYSVAELSSNTSILLSGEANAINDHTVRDKGSVELEDSEWNKIKERQVGNLLTSDEIASLVHHFTQVEPDALFKDLFIVFADRLTYGALKEQVEQGLNENLSKLQELMKDPHSKGVYCVCLFTTFHWITVVINKNQEERFYVVSNSAHNSINLKESAFIELLQLLGENIDEKELSDKKGLGESKNGIAEWAKDMSLEQLLGFIPSEPLLSLPSSPIFGDNSMLDLGCEQAASKQADEEQVQCTLCSRSLTRKEALAYQSSYLCSHCMQFLV